MFCKSNFQRPTLFVNKTEFFTFSVNHPVIALSNLQQRMIRTFRISLDGFAHTTAISFPLLMGKSSNALEKRCQIQLLTR